MFKIQWVLSIGIILIFFVVPMMLASIQEIPTAKEQAPTKNTAVKPANNVPDHIVVHIEPCKGTPKYNAEEVEAVIPEHYDIPLSMALQDHVYDQLDRFGLPESEAKTIFAMMYVESRYDTDAVNSDGSCRGLLQIHKIHDEGLAEIGVYDVFDPYQNITAGVSIFKDCWEWAADYPDADRTAYALLAYNNGESGARKLVEKGETESRYVNSVFAARDALKPLE